MNKKFIILYLISGMVMATSPVLINNQYPDLNGDNSTVTIAKQTKTVNGSQYKEFEITVIPTINDTIPHIACVFSITYTKDDWEVYGGLDFLNIDSDNINRPSLPTKYISQINVSDNSDSGSKITIVPLNSAFTKDDFIVAIQLVGESFNPKVDEIRLYYTDSKSTAFSFAFVEEKTDSNSSKRRSGKINVIIFFKGKTL